MVRSTLRRSLRFLADRNHTVFPALDARYRTGKVHIGVAPRRPTSAVISVASAPHRVGHCAGEAPSGATRADAQNAGVPEGAPHLETIAVVMALRALALVCLASLRGTTLGRIDR